ncbi:UTP-glucose-1-phosphate uridylyltransferase [Tenacibaculum sp. MAR_2009_124]|uniref:nucleotidyltransferase family protein n=1 Tax=Tenacibaculum sp. MAR_2009_124 TaxID=1250059 RepID=UPI00089544F6|nr:sugar phosphate nucleotidyltransferase [Tenacibaculum sp. MAR_2009_124]SEB81850.1 UTP-glucose-1-phosphate uridylyltransferase [Tenacibaculum sp. MAR_2009_124]
MGLTLLVMAAGMGSRFGGLKQLSPINNFNETIIDYSVFDAKRAGFTKVVFVIRKEFEDDFKNLITHKYKNHIEVDFVYQNTKDLPRGFDTNPNREKPWGTGHAIWCCRKNISDNFAVINADDFYGSESFKVIAKHLNTLKTSELQNQCMVGYKLINTLSDNGSVSRGICKVNSEHQVTSITERTQIEKKNDTIVFTEDNKETILSADDIASMNMFGLTPATFQAFENDFKSFLADRGSELKSEFYLPTVINNLIARNQSAVTVLPTNAKWFGMTYKEDKAIVENNIKILTESGEYPEKLWNS